MKVSHIGAIAVLVISGFAVFQNCAPPAARLSDDTAPEQFQNLEKLQDELHTLAESDLTCMDSSDCHLIEVGVAPCGGPDYHLLVSTRNSQYQAVLSLAEEYSYQDKIQTRPDLVGTCAMILPEVASCVAHTCIKQLETFN